MFVINLTLACLQMPIDTSEPDVRDWLKDSYLGRVVMFLSRLPDETAENRAVARDLVDKWVSPRSSALLVSL